VVFAYVDDGRTSLGIGRVALHDPIARKYILRYMMIPEHPENPLESLYSRVIQNLTQDELVMGLKSIIVSTGIKFNKCQ
jgi:hypothetical protein